MPDGTLLLSAQIRTREQANMVFHVVSRTGSILRSFGNDIPRDDDPQGHQADWIDFAVARDNASVWKSPRRTYRLKQWAMDGTVLRDYQITDAPWIPGRNLPRSEAEIRPGPRITIGGFDAQGRVWINGHVPKTSADFPDWDRHVELFDPVTGKVVVSFRTNRDLYTVEGAADLMFSIDEAPNGNFVYTIWRVQVRRP
jgi:hypothetical protein